jgi:hypothetical protein
MLYLVFTIFVTSMVQLLLMNRKDCSTSNKSSRAEVCKCRVSEEKATQRAVRICQPTELTACHEALGYDVYWGRPRQSSILDNKERPRSKENTSATTTASMRQRVGPSTIHEPS